MVVRGVSGGERKRMPPKPCLDGEPGFERTFPRFPEPRQGPPPDRPWGAALRLLRPLRRRLRAHLRLPRSVAVLQPGVGPRGARQGRPGVARGARPPRGAPDDLRPPAARVPPLPDPRPRPA